MNADQVASLVRQVLTFAGATFLAKWVDAGTMGQIAGAVAVLASTFWSMLHHSETKVV